MALERRKDRGGTYYGIWYVNGRRIQRSLKTKIKAEAIEFHRKLESEIWREHYLQERTYLWSYAVVHYLGDKEDSPSYSADLQRLEWLSNNGLTPETPLEAINVDFLTDIRDKRKALVRPSTVNRMMSFVSAILHYAEDREWIVRAPRIPKAKIEVEEPEYLTPDEVKLLLEALNTPRSKHLVPFVKFAIATGLRMRNITYLEWGQVDLARKRIIVKASKSKNRKTLTVPLSQSAIDIIRDRMKAQEHPVRVFTHNGKPFDRVNQRTLRNAAQRCGIEKRIHPHLFRHTFASWHVMSGTSLHELMVLGGWSKMDSVLIYAHLSDEHMLDAAGNISNVFENLR